MSYVNCPNCNQKALSVATRCPRCGVAFEGRLAERPRRPPRRLPLVALLAATAMSILAVVNLVQQRVTARGPMEPPPPEAHAAPPRPLAPAPAAATTVAVESARPVPAPPPREPVPAAAAPIQAPDSAAAARPAGPPPHQQRYANTWVNVRSGRSPTAAVTRVLNPGESVAVDQPELGWYRVQSEGQVLGYVDGRFLDSTPR